MRQPYSPDAAPPFDFRQQNRIIISRNNQNAQAAPDAPTAAVKAEKRRPTPEADMDAAGSLNLIGYAGSAIAILSFLAASSARQRLINAVGCLILVFYCYSMQAYPTTICNAFTCALDIIILARLLGSHKHNYSVVDSCVSDGVYKAFIQKHAADISKYYPQFRPEDPHQNFVRFIFSDDEIAGLQVGIKEGEILHLTADYSIPAYRDCSVGRYAYSHMEDTGSKLVDVSTPNAQAKDYLRHVGFRGQGGKLALRLNYAHRGA